MKETLHCYEKTNAVIRLGVELFLSLWS